MPETWYLATDMQLFLFSPLLIYLIWRWPKVGVACLAIGLFACTAGNAAAFITLDLPFTVRVFHESGDSTSYWENYYQDPWFRAQPYLIGISLGCILRHYRPNEIKLSKVNTNNYN